MTRSATQRVLRAWPAGFLAAVVAIGACSSGTYATRNSVPVQPRARDVALKDLFANDFFVGAAINRAQFEGVDTAGAALVRRQFNTISPENVLKWESVHPTPGTFDFGPSDKYVAFGEQNRMAIIGHTLVWHSQTPAWVFRAADGTPATRDTLLARMRDHIRTVVGRYKGRVHGWDVVNEALNEDGTLRKSPWLAIIGEDFIAKAFQFAHEADPKAELYYNDYSLENPAKRDGAIRLVKSLQAQGIAVHAIGSQGHMKMDWPTVELEDTMITRFAALGVKVNVTELDIDVLPSSSGDRSADVSRRLEASSALNPWTSGLPDSVSTALAHRYARMFALYRKHRVDIERITFWGVSDGDSWLNGWPIRGRTSYPLPFDRQHRGKAAFDSIAAVAREPMPGKAAKGDNR